MNRPVRRPVRLGMLTPSSNTTIEPVTAASSPACRASRALRRFR